MLCDAVDVSEEAHVQHAVCFIEDEDVQLAQVYITEVHVTDHATRGYDGNVHTCGQGVFFAIEIAAASPSIDRHTGCTREITESFAGLVNLECEFARGRDDQALDVVAASCFMDVVHRGQQECSRLARTGLGDSNEVFSFRNGRDGEGLNRCRHFETHGIESFLNGVAEGQFFE